MLANSIVDQIYLLAVSFIFVARCGHLCDAMKHTYAAQLYMHYIFYFTTNSLAFFSIFLEIAIIEKRFSMLKKNRNITFKSRLHKRLYVFVFLFIFSFVYHAPQLSVFKIVQINANNSTSLSHVVVYTRKIMSSEKSFLNRNLLAFQTMMRLILYLVIVLLLIRLSKLAFRKYEAIKRENINEEETNKKQLTQNKRNVTKMVIYTSLIYLMGNLINPFVYFFIVVFGAKFEGYVVVVTLIGNTLQFGSYGLNMFVFYAFNNKYKTVLKQVI